MGNTLACKKNKRREVQSLSLDSKNQYAPKKKKKKTIVLEKNCKIIQKDKEMYQLIFDAQGFSVLDLALLGQKTSEETVIRRGVVPRNMGKVELVKDVTSRLQRKNDRKAHLQQPKSPNSPMGGTSSCQNQESASVEDFQVVEIHDYIDNLYLQLLDPDRELDDRKDNSTASNTESNPSR